ncbi:MAG: PQQ-binding-like beta-propeller repeat protein [Planctomycetes bacterium]|nr:PQQ-binding-like beta-propeller repeat protein [Planctomycetota bacterium]
MTAARNVQWNVIIAAALMLAAPPASNAQWTQWGGPTRDFKVDGVKLADAWPKEGPKVKWSRELGPGYSAILVDEGIVYAMYHTTQAAAEGPPMDQSTKPPDTDKGGRDHVIAMDADDGRIKWEYDYENIAAKGQALDFGKGPNATPIIFGKHLYTISFTGRMFQFNRNTGKSGFIKDLVGEFGGKMQEFGYSAAPIMHGKNLIVLVGGKDAGVIAINTVSGDVAWKSAAYDISYASPILITVDGDDQIVFMTPTEVVAISAKDGAFRWKHEHANSYKNNCFMPIWDAGRRLLFVSSHSDGGSRTLKIGKAGDTWKAEQVWFDKKTRVFHSSGVLVGDTIYATLSDEPPTFLAAVNILTGEVKWKERGFNKANVLHADGKLIILDEDGQLALAKASPEKCEILSKVQLLDKVAWTAPTLVKDTLYVRDQKKIMALSVGNHK